jgi:enoyl-CoA hydratase/isomerase-like protein
MQGGSIYPKPGGSITRNRAFTSASLNRCFATIRNVAALQGHVLGAGFGLATCADIIVDSRNALLGLAEEKGGIVDEFGGMHRAIQQTPCRVTLTMDPPRSHGAKKMAWACCVSMYSLTRNTFPSRISNNRWY